MLLPTRVLGLPQSIDINWGPDKKFRQGFTGTPASAGRGKNKQQIALLACLLPAGWVSVFLIWGGGGRGELGVVPGSSWRRGLGVWPTP